LSHGSYEAMLDHIRYNDVSVHMLSIATVDCRLTEQEVVDRVKQVLESFGFADEYSVVTPINRLVTILPRKTSKGTGLLALCNHLSISPSEIAAIGDANNDIEMLKIAGIPVAMGNAKEELKAHATLIVNPNNHPELPGVAQLLRWIIDSHSSCSL
jgi:hydroxymethylpyrimidine pyrophosphatase-like HAD family hydrolase